MYIVSEQNPPPLRGGDYWERCADPFHADAFAGTGVDVDKAIVIGGEISKGSRKEGWMLIDWAENPIGFCADGAEMDGEPQAFVFKANPFGHLSAYPEGSYKLQEHEGKDWRRK